MMWQGKGCIIICIEFDDREFLGHYFVSGLRHWLV